VNASDSETSTNDSETSTSDSETSPSEELPIVQTRIIMLRAKIFRLLSSNIIKNEKRIKSDYFRKQVSAAGGRK
jgi:hypothetical protein